MKKTSKFIILLTLITITAFGYLIYYRNVNDYVRITDVDYQAVINDVEFSNGSVIIKERLTFDVHAISKNNLFWELWRELPEAYYDGVKVSYDVKSVKQILDDNTSIEFLESPVLYWDDNDYIDDSGYLGPNKWYHSEGPYDDYYFYESLIFYVDGLYREQVTFEIVYEMFNATLRYNDSSELYLAMYSGDTIKYLNSFNGEILIPEAKMPKSDNFNAYTYGTNKHSFDMTLSETLHPGFYTFKFNLDKNDLQFKKYNEYLEFALISFNEDKHIFSEFASENYYYDIDMLDSINFAQKEYELLPELYHQRKLTTLKATSTISLIVFAIFAFQYTIFSRKYKIFKPSSNIDYYRDIPSDLDANFARKLIFSKKYDVDDFGDGYSAAMLSLVDKGYIKIEVLDQNKQLRAGNFVIRLDNRDPSLQKPLTNVEKQYFDLIVRHLENNEITVLKLQNKVKEDYEYTNKFDKQVNANLLKIGVDEGYFQTKNYKLPQKVLKVVGSIFILIALISIFVINFFISDSRLDLAYGSYFILGFTFLILGIFMLIRSKNYILLTQFGQDEYEKWNGLYKFLNNETLMVERGVQDLVLWEKYLIYATAFGISAKVIKALKIVLPKEVIAESIILSNRIYATRSFRSSGRSFYTSIRSASYSYSSGGHGGYGGGGRGGGGGGGGH